jgi:uncharacterized protein YbjQ (UPF0145 family)
MSERHTLCGIANRLPGRFGLCFAVDHRGKDSTPCTLFIPKGASVNHSLTTTAFTLDGYRIEQTKGIVRGIVVRSRSIIGTLGASLQTLIGGNISLFTQLCERTREEAFQLMLEHAQQQGANAVIGIRYDATEVMGGVTEVLCYGTAVVVAPATLQGAA